MKRPILLIIMTLIGSTSCSLHQNKVNVWTPEYEAKERNEIDNVMKTRLPDPDARERMVNFTIDHLKQELPRGLDSVTPDSLHRLSIKIGKEYGYAHTNDMTGLAPHFVPWSPEMEQIFKEAFLHEAKDGDEANAAKLCDCMIRELKKIYPDSVMMPLPHSVVKMVVASCVTHPRSAHRER